MVNPNLDIVVKLEQKIDKLVESYKSEKEENKMLRTQITQLSSQLEQSASSYALLQEEYDKLKIAKTIEASGADVRDTKQRINQIVREIDKCIALLNR